MPRIPHSLILQAFNISSLLPLTLRATRDLQSAKNELRWLVEQVQERVKVKKAAGFIRQRKVLLNLCRRRERGEPLQYILGSQPFGDLNIKCRPGVLIPRPETEAYTSYLAKLLISRSVPGITYENHDKTLAKIPDAVHNRLRILDICTGSGCISLLLISMLQKKFRLLVRGLDISEDAVDLARENQVANGLFGLDSTKTIFMRRDLFARSTERHPYDVVISNPPYISETEFRKGTSRSVRNWEPKLALVPPGTTNVEDPDIFYRRIMELERDLFHSKILIMEIGGRYQAHRVVKMAFELLGKRAVEIWRDDPGPKQCNESIEVPDIRQEEFARKWRTVKAWGTGRRRAVVIYGRDIPPTRDTLGVAARSVESI